MEADDSVERAIVQLLLTKNPDEVESLADDLGAMGDRGLSDRWRPDPQRSDAVRRLSSAIPRRFFPAS